MQHRAEDSADDDACVECSIRAEEASTTPESVPPAPEPDHIPPQDLRPVPVLSRPTSTRGRKGTQAELVTGSPYKAQLKASIAAQELKLSRRGGRRGRRRGGSTISNRGKRRLSFADQAGDIEDTTLPSTSFAAPARRSQTRTRAQAPQRSLRQRSATSSSSSSAESSNSDIETQESDCSLEEFGPQGDCPDDAHVLCMFCTESYSSDRGGEPWIRCMTCHNWTHVACADCVGDATSFHCDFCKEETRLKKGRCSRK